MGLKSFESQAEQLLLPDEDKMVEHRLTLRVPVWLMEKIDDKRKEGVGRKSRNLWILEAIAKATGSRFKN